MYPFGCTVDFMSKPDVVRALPKFATRASVGLLVGYHLQPGGEFKGEYEVFPKERFAEYDFDVPKGLNELRPVRTLEVRRTDREPEFPMRPLYKQATRSVTLQTVA